MSLEIKALYKKYDTISLFSDFNISFQEGTITCILGLQVAEKQHC